jgi:predicted Zn-dependent protease
MGRLSLSLILMLNVLPAGTSSAERSYRLVGAVVREDGKPFRNVTPVVFLHGAITPFSAKTAVGPDGRFTFKKLPAATYTLIVDVPRLGEVRKTVEVGPSFADSRGQVTARIAFDRTSSVERQNVISALDLSIPSSARQEYERADSLLGRRDVQGAVESLKKAVAIAPQFSAAWNHLGTIAYQTKQYQDAERYFREALKQDPDAYAPLVNLGGALLSEGKIADSLPINQSAVKARPDDPLAQSQLGQSYFYLNRLDEAERHLKQAELLDPGHFSYPQVFLVEIYARRNQLPAAISEIEGFLKLHPDSEMADQMRKALEKARAGLPAKP